MTEDQLEQACIQWLTQGGWEASYGPDIAFDGPVPERADYKHVLLYGDLENALRTLNPQLPGSAIEDVMATLKKPISLDTTTSNRHFHKWLLEGVPVDYKKEDQLVSDRAFLVDFDRVANNRFRAINQFTLLGRKGLRRPDIVCFINGLPLVVLELKNPIKADADIWDAFEQLQTYKDEVPDLFVYNEALIVSDGITARVGSLTADKERFLPWRTLSSEDDKPQLELQLETMVRGFLDRELLLDYLRHFVLFEQNAEKIVKKIAGYHQFHAVRAAVKATVIASQNAHNLQEPRANYAAKVLPGSKKAGVIWHTQGSGKSISMCCYAGKLLQQPEMNNPTLIVVTDRNDLDGQLLSTFAQARDLLKQDPVQADGRDTLRTLLSERESGGIIFTTVQKFALLDGEIHHPILNVRHNIVVISDEAHRSQYGLKANLDKKDGRYKFGYAKHMRDALPNASFIGFTGTPIESIDKDTRAVFGDYVSIYDIQDAVDDGATVPIYYESRLAKLDINHAEIAALSDQVEEIVEDEEDLSAREKTKSEWSRLEKLVGAEPRLKQIARDLVTHFDARCETSLSKAMIVGMSREICVHLYNEIVALKPDWHSDDPEKGAIKIVMTGSASDKALLQPHIYSKHIKKRFEARFKDPDDVLKIVIVRDMWLTGFDAPCCNTMYIDKPMQGHNLMQAIARVNRVFRNKKGGLVVDYIGIANELKQALKTYTDSRGRGEPTHDIREAFAIFLEKLDVIRGLLAPSPEAPGLDYSDFTTAPLPTLIETANYIVGLKDGKKRFLDAVLAMNKAFSLCNTLDEAQQYQEEVAFFSQVKTLFAKHTSVDKKLLLEEKNSVLKHILNNALVAQGVLDVFAMCGLEKPDIALLSDQFLEDIRRLPQKNLAVELLEKLLQDTIKAKTRNNVVQEKRYRDRLEETLRRYNNRGIETAQVIEELIAMAHQFKADIEREAALGLNPAEIAFYDALATNESAVRELGDATLKAIAIEITEKLRKSTTVDWQVRESVRSQLRILVRRTLQRYKYPPDKTPEAIELVLKQAEVLSNEWTK
jgi:type I restriction enzyme R subunit